jgi:HAD superfamily hydrolase (TIGR01509 family)
MIRNIIFDLGNVLISFKPEEYLKRKYPGDKANIILGDIFQSPEWPLLDRGTLDVNEAIKRIEKKSALTRAEIASVFNLRAEIMFPLEENTKMLYRLKKEGLRLYYLSNFHLDIFYEFKNKYPFFENFDGGVISAEVNHSKPDHEIYRILIKKYNLDPPECLFIDDTEINVKTAESLGMKGYYTNGSEKLNLYEVI